VEEAGMESIEGMMKGMRLSEEERKGVKINWKDAGRGEAGEGQAIGKLMAQKPAVAEAIENALGPIWCPMKGIDCKDLGENVFLFTFRQSGGKKKAINGGPWMFDNELLVLEEFVPTKAVDEYEFSQVPVWVRIYKLPLGLMSRSTAESIGGLIGEYMETDGVADGLAVGKYLRVKVKKKIATPLMRGTMVETDDKGSLKWCPFEYEHLPDFCFICGIMGHVNKECDIKLRKGEEPQFGKWLNWVPPKKKSYSDSSRRWYEKGAGGYGKNWGERSGGRKMFAGSGGSKFGSDAPFWRKDNEGSQSNTKSTNSSEEEVALQLSLREDVVGNKERTNERDRVPEQFQLGRKTNTNKVVNNRETEIVVDAGSMQIDSTKDLQGLGSTAKGCEYVAQGSADRVGKGSVAGANKKKGTYKKVERGQKVEVGNNEKTEKKRKGNEMDVDDLQNQKKNRTIMMEEKCTDVNTLIVGAGLSEQLRESQ
jgi:hypothetical protein